MNKYRFIETPLRRIPLDLLNEADQKDILDLNTKRQMKTIIFSQIVLNYDI